MSAEVECAVPAISRAPAPSCQPGPCRVCCSLVGALGAAMAQCAMRHAQLTWIALEPDLAAVPLAGARSLNALRPCLLDPFLERLANVRWGVDDPHAVGRVERYGEEDWVRVRLAEEERERVFARVCGELSMGHGCSLRESPFLDIRNDEVSLYPSRANSVMRYTRMRFDLRISCGLDLHLASGGPTPLTRPCRRFRGPSSRP